MKHKRNLNENANEYLEVIFIDKKEPKINVEYLSNLFLISQKKKPRNITLRIQTRGFSFRVIHFDH